MLSLRDRIAFSLMSLANKIIVKQDVKERARDDGSDSVNPLKIIVYAGEDMFVLHSENIYRDFVGVFVELLKVDGTIEGSDDDIGVRFEVFDARTSTPIEGGDIGEFEL